MNWGIMIAIYCIVAIPVLALIGLAVKHGGATSTLFGDGVRVIAEGRPETEECQAGTPGCCIDHTYDRGGCECW